MISSPAPLPLHRDRHSLRHEELVHLLSQTENLLIIQDLDGVCMGLVKDPLTRSIDPNYVEAAQAFAPHFYVLTNGEHVGQRGVNRIIDRAIAPPGTAGDRGLFLPGLAAGGVQWQDQFGRVSHPGVTEQELAFLGQVPPKIQRHLRDFFQHHAGVLGDSVVDVCIEAAVLDNLASPTANLNVFYEHLSDRPPVYQQLQQHVAELMNILLQEAAGQGMEESFFVHYAPNLGRDEQGLERLRLATATDSGTTDFQFMLRGAVKEAGVLAILNHYIAQRTGHYPLGETFSARTAPKRHEELVQQVRKAVNPEEMPLIVGVGDTVNSSVEHENGRSIVRRGGSDRNFLRLVQDIGREFNRGNVIVYVDSSGGEVLNRKPVRVVDDNGTSRVTEGPCDANDENDPLELNVIIPGGHHQYCALFQRAAHLRDRQH